MLTNLCANRTDDDDLAQKPKDSVIIHSRQGSQLGSDEFNRWCKHKRLSPSMICQGNSCDNALTESFFISLKREQIKKWIYQTGMRLN
jgi:putative transposase